MVIFVDGQFADAGARHISALDRGFALGDGVFETMRAYDRRIFRLEAHLRRLRDGAARIGFELSWSDADLATIMAETMRRNSLADAVLRLTVSRGVPPSRGLAPPPDPRPTLVAQAMAVATPSAAEYARGWSVALATVRRNEWSPLSNIKSGNYLDNVLAKMEAAAAGADDAIMLNTAGGIACASAANVFVVVGERLVTPSLACGALPGVTRAAVIELATTLGLNVVERALYPLEMVGADEAFLTNSVVEVLPLVRFEDESIGDARPGPVTRQLAEAYRALTQATEGDGLCNP